MFRSLLISAALLAPTAAVAAETSVTSRYKANDVQSVAQAPAALAEIRQQARRACERAGSRTIAEIRQERDCADEIVALAVAKINAPQLTAAFQGGAPTVTVASLNQ